VPVLRQCLAIRDKNAPTNWRAFETRTLLGGALLYQKKYAEAQPLLRDGYLGLKQRVDQLPLDERSRMRDALGWLIELAEAWEDKEAAEKWRKEREGLGP